METENTIDKSPVEISRDKLSQDFKALVLDAEELLRATSDDLGDKVKEARERLESALEKTRASFDQYEEKAMARARATDQMIRDHPYQSMGAAFGVGLLLGILFRR